MPNRIEQIAQIGQSIWYDNIRRQLIASGELQALVAQGIRGVTSNPTIFEKAIVASHDYDEAIAAGAQAGLSVEQLYDQLVLEDIARAADILRPVYDRTDGLDGYISIEVPPTLAADTSATINEAHRLVALVRRPNIMIKVPATPEGIPAVRQLIADGIHVNVTLIFSLDGYDQVMDAYMGGLEIRRQQGLPVDHIASVASFFVSRVDTLVDRLIDEQGLPGDLHGQAAVANAKVAYALFRERFTGKRFAALKALGARVQRPLWASTSTKNPAYPDLLYVDGLIGPDTVNTLPPATVAAVLDHAQTARTVDQDLAAARAHLDRLASFGINMQAVTETLQQDGVASFQQSFVTLLRSLGAKRAQVIVRQHPVHASFGRWEPVVREGLAAAKDRGLVDAVWNRDPGLWKSDPADQAVIANALGWLAVPDALRDTIAGLPGFVAAVRAEGFTQAVLLGMGGSSLVSDVVRQAFSAGTGDLELHVLDSTHPRTIQELTESLPIAHTLFLVASKSGTTTEPDAFFRYFWERVKAVNKNPGSQFVAITDPGTRLANQAAELGFRQTFLNPADIGGRFSALSLFGLVPAALHGVDVPGLVERAQRMQAACRVPDPESNPGAWLGIALGQLARHGVDKVTFVMPAAVAYLADWLEQLLAESTGKEGRGLIPVAHEPPLRPDRYGPDRVFVVYRMSGEATPPLPAGDGDHPVIVITLPDAFDLAAEFFRWEFAVAAAGAILEINAFNQPNVQESKDNTRRLLETFQRQGSLGEDPATADDAGLRYTAQDPAQSLKTVLAEAASTVQPGDYVALMAYCPPSAETDAQLAALRQTLGNRLGVATTLGYGPRFLHSTGQEHKGGPNRALFIQLVSSQGPKIPIPGLGADFMTLIQAQSLGDYQALGHHDRKVIRILLPNATAPGLEQITLLAGEIPAKD
ncbi:MAG: bifunctional transaldolase/phosoglucose isomerase [Thermaerobacter sp.]|nr:bifunctional transaldolase/phosoglucose isomerase [Thermaerobacter sp.]